MLEKSCGAAPVGFRAPGLSLSVHTLGHLARLGFEYDASFPRWLVGIGGTAAGAMLWALPDKTLAFRVLSRVHRSGGSDTATALIERVLARAGARERNGQATGLWRFFEDHTKRSVEVPQANGVVKRPLTLLGYRVLVLKSASDDERGVIVVDYSYIFPLFAALFDVPAIARRYHIVLEPSWRGLCTADILSYSRYDFPVFVESSGRATSRSSRGSARTSGRCRLRPTGGSITGWCSRRRIARDIDVIMVAAWSASSVTGGSSACSRRYGRAGTGGVALVGYKTDRNLTHIEGDARALACGVNADLTPLVVAAAGLLCGSLAGAAFGFGARHLTTIPRKETHDERFE
jgi:hypothetical protein